MDFESNKGNPTELCLQQGLARTMFKNGSTPLRAFCLRKKIERKLSRAARKLATDDFYNSFSRVPVKFRVLLYQQFFDDIVKAMFRDSGKKIISPKIGHVKTICKSLEAVISAKQKETSQSPSTSRNMVFQKITYTEADRKQKLIDHPSYASTSTAAKRRQEDLETTMEVDPAEPPMKIFRVSNDGGDINAGGQQNVGEMFRLWLIKKLGMTFDDAGRKVAPQTKKARSNNAKATSQLNEASSRSSLDNERTLCTKNNSGKLKRGCENSDSERSNVSIFAEALIFLISIATDIL